MKGADHGSRSQSRKTAEFRVVTAKKQLQTGVEVKQRSNFIIRSPSKDSRESSNAKKIQISSPVQREASNDPVLKARDDSKKLQSPWTRQLTFLPSDLLSPTKKKTISKEVAPFEISTKSQTKESSESERPILFIKRRKSKGSVLAHKKAQDRSPSPEIITSTYFRFQNLSQESCHFMYWKECVQSIKALHNDRYLDEPSVPEHPLFKNSSKPVLALDLDETLVHCCNFDEVQTSWETSITYCSLKTGSSVLAKINCRPHATSFLKRISQHFDVVVFSSSELDYATAVAGFLDPLGLYIKRIYPRGDCIRTERGFLVKDLRYVTGEDTSKVVLVDNSVSNFAPQIHNGIPILPYYSGTTDQELPKLFDFLMMLKQERSIPHFLKNYFGLSKLTKCKSDAEILKHLEELGNNFQ